ncbi:cysteine/glutathione ABC transporter permease/ATP-binding protein CydD [Shewanella sp. 5_MG-2023]|uniref:heme ABC transporter permease/ATP-binding protein CydD n=1 Tax=unclassified Shewanella TaxID=196818 RepID=UPI0026E1C6C1|nr:MULTISPECIES: cysteine/glutathione ABC transporter permease/ATP-binding protein CydD [unclassified Shewanella]MDO6617968.1 cysteine/glutathione ABC transporter permease/ATP-binding protein CydD [Shewanella sp. 6_MG-2023]MDO6639903.1 cysteine/glutathione ABC transporter permease/ATP-binding protein CydD [Shewanella sp. 5_MG-2023]MDO6678256.1 cysteine/glutathione ABC transporter permease/ATP-binding protein CydD [Shewanella sp. 4_MG-2023]
MDKTLEKSLTHWLKSQKSSCGIFLKLAIFTGAANGVAIVAQAYLLATILHGVIMLELPMGSFTLQFGALISLILVRAVLAYARERLSFEAGKRLRGDIREAVLNKLTDLGPAFIKGKPAGAWASVVLEQVEDLHDFYAKYLPQMMLAAFIPLIILVAVFPLNWASGLILLATAPLIPMFMILVGMGAADANRKNFSALSRLSGHFMDRLKGISTLKLFHRAEAEVKQIETGSEDFRQRTMSVLRMAFLSSAVLEFFAALSIAVLAVYFGFSYLEHLNFGHYGVKISLFTGMFVLILAPEFFQPLRDLGTHYHAKAQAIGAAEALVELLEHPNPLKQVDENFSEQTGQLRNTDLSKIVITATDLEVLTLEGKPLLGPISFSIKAGEHIAIVGPSGAGKTSLLNALLGFLPYRGSLQINAAELSLLDKNYWRSRLAWLGQDPQLFHGSIRDNVSLGNAQLSDAEIMALLQQANIADFVQAHPQGLDAIISDQSAGISVGQAQRIALARALSQPASLFLLDEPTASLDNQSEQLVSAALNQAKLQQTSLMITHRLDQLQDMDNILVIDNGKLVQQGDYKTLSQQPGLFKSMQQQDDGLSLFITAESDTDAANVNNQAEMAQSIGTKEDK